MKSPTQKQFLLLGFLFLLSIILVQRAYHFGRVYTLSISSDGHYVISANEGKKLVLWDIKKKTWKIAARNVNIYSPYFIKNTHAYMWQNDKSNVVYVSNINGKILKTLTPHFPTYGEIITSDFKHYFASDEKWNLTMIADGHERLIRKGFIGFFAYGKLLNLRLSPDNKQLLTAGFGSGWDKEPLAPANNPIDGNIIADRELSLLNGIVLWDVNTGLPIRKFSGSRSKVFATFSPDGKYIVSGDENTFGYVWSTDGHTKMELWSLWLGKPAGKKKDGDIVFSDKGLNKPPKDFRMEDGVQREFILSMKFIDKTHYLRFTTYIPYAILYALNNPNPLKYFPLGTKPLPRVDEYSLNQSLNTAPAAHILVMGQSDHKGIIVYQYDPAKQTLKRIWVA